MIISLAVALIIVIWATLLIIGCEPPIGRHRKHGRARVKAAVSPWFYLQREDAHA